MSEAAPVTAENRVKSLDVLRGFALLGILAVNAAFFAAPWQAAIDPTLPPLAITQETLWSWFVMHVFFEFKCITLFSILFGASVYMVGGEVGDKERSGILVRRLLWLLVFGLIHALLIWYGDILVTYAITGFAVMLARSWKPGTLITVGILLYVVSVLMQSLLAIIMPIVPADQMGVIRSELEAVFAMPPEELERIKAAYQGGVLSGIEQNAGTWVEFAASSLIGLVIRTAGVMMIGMALFKLGFLSGRAPIWVYALFALLGVGALSVIGYQAWLNWQAGFELMHMMTNGMIANTALSIFGTLGYISILILLVKAGAKLLTEPLAAVGRMAFTNYLTQSLIMTTIFYGGRGLGYWGEVDRPTLWAVVLGVWALQLIWSPLWLSRFQMGPLEWVWRRLSYGKPVRMAK